MSGGYQPGVSRRKGGNQLFVGPRGEIAIQGGRITGLTTGVVYYVDPQNGSDTSIANDGLSWLTAKASMAALDDLLDHGDIICLRGVLEENWTTAPALNDITIIGCANTPRRATTDGEPNGGGATWLREAGNNPLVHLGNASTTLECQGWSFHNIFFANDGSAACVKLERKLTGADPSHASFYNCKFTGAGNGIESVEASFLTVHDCEFFNFTTAAKGGIQSITGEGVALPLQWDVRRNKFWNNVRHLTGALSSAVITDNDFGWKGSSITTTIQVDLTGGKNNSVMLNRFAVAHNATGSGAMFEGGTDDAWLNYYSGGLTTAVPST